VSSRSEEGVTTAPLVTQDSEIAELRAEVERLKRQLAEARGLSSEPEASAASPGNATTIPYADQPYSGARLTGITRDRDRIRPSSDFPELPVATRDMARLEADFMRWGYCLVAEALSPGQVRAQVDRLVDQADAERAAGVAHLSHRGSAQLIFNMMSKGQAFRDLAALEPVAAVGGPLVETLLEKILGAGYYLCTAHGSIVGEHGGRQELHQDQGFVPLPHPPYPLYCLIIWTYSEFGLEEGGTYIVPGSHRDAAGNNRVEPDAAFETLADGRLVALTAPPGVAVLTDSRLLHSGGKRTAAGTRYASRILYGRGMMRQQENQYLSVPDAIVAGASEKFRKLMGYQSYYGLGMVDGNTIDPARPAVHVGELSMSRPEEFQQDFDWRYTEDARRLSELEWNDSADYRKKSGQR